MHASVTYKDYNGWTSVTATKKQTVTLISSLLKATVDHLSTQKLFEKEQEEIIKFNLQKRRIVSWPEK